MSFLSKRSRSQIPYKPGSEEISVRRLEGSGAIAQCRTDSFHSDSSSPPNATDFALYDSCVLRKFPKHKSSHLRFLAWVAYTRKFTDDPITEDERRTCPLLWCRHVFKDQERMLQHVWECEHLTKGLYWCFHCQRPEKIGSFECRRCQGIPSKTDRITTVAKRIFSKLGSKRHRTQPAPEPEPDMSIAKYSETAKTLENHPDFSNTCDAGPVESFDTTEMTSAGLLEGSSSWPRISQELPDTQICEMTGSDCPLELSTGPENWMTQGFPACPERWFSPNASAKNVEHPKSRGSLDMLPPLNTQLGQGNLVGNFTGTDPTSFSDEPMSATIISPLGTNDRFASIFQEISPTDTEESGMSFLTDSGYTSATVLSSWGDSSMPNFELHPGFNEPRGKKRWRDGDYVVEHKTHAASTAVSRNNSAKSLSSSKRKANNAIESTTSTHSPSRCPSTKKPKMQSPHWSSAATLVQSFSEVLDAHIYHTKEILRYLPQTPITTELLALSRSSLVSIGLEALAGIIEGRNPTAIVQSFAFTHVAYAFTIAMDHDEIKVHTQEWFRDSLSWVDGLGSERERARYSKIAQAIWKPVESLSEGPLPRLFSVSPENRLYLVCKRFLDVLESFGSSDVKISTDSVPNVTPTTFPKRAQAQVIDELIKTVSIEAFIEDVVKVEKRLNRGHIKSVRELELELMCAGKCASQSELAYNRFLAHVTHRCNSLYGSSPTRSRAEHHIRDIALVKILLPEESFSDQGQEEERNFELELEDDLPLGFQLDTLGRCDKRLGDSLNEFIRDADNSLKSHCDISRCDSTQSLSAHVTIPPRRPKASERHPVPSVSHRPVPSYDLETPRSPQKRQRSNYHESPSASLLFSPSRPESVISSFTPNTTSAATPLPPAQSSNPQSFQCNLCDYIPMGEEKWKASNIRRHKRTQHASKGSYLCKWPGCAKIFTRSDNLRSHMKAQGHGLGAGITKGGEGEEDDEEDDADVVGATRGSEGRWNEREDGERAPKRVRMVGE